MTSTLIAPELSRAEALRVASHSTHESLDATIMAARPFDNLANYARFLKVQYVFHRDVSPLYVDPALGALFADLPGLARMPAVAADIASVGADLPQANDTPAATGLALPEALGWLYVVEGSNLGAAFLLKAAKKMGLSETHGAAHLAEGQLGRAAQWRLFKEALNAAPLGKDEEARVVAGAQAAFARVRSLVDLYMK